MGTNTIVPGDNMSYNKFPDDDNGHVLRNMELSGDDLSKARNIDFSLVFYDESSANEFCKMTLNKMKFICKSFHDDSDLWDVTVTVNMIPTHSAITSMEDILERIATPLGGQNDGWGCFSVPKLSS